MTVTREQLVACLSVPRWADDVLAGQPYADRTALLARADEAARTLSDEELEQALSGHPRIGERGGAQSQREQAGVDPAAGDTAARLAAGNAAYEQRFGRVFLIRAAGRDAEADPGRARPPARQRRRDRAGRDRRQPAADRVAAPGGARLMATLSTHVLDTAVGRPAAGIAVRLESRDGDVLDQGVTDADGRVGSLGGELALGAYVLRFDTGCLRQRLLPRGRRRVHRRRRPAPPRAAAAQPVRLLDLPWQLTSVIRARRAIVAGAEVAASVAVADGRIVAVTAYDDVPDAASVVTLDDDEVLLPGLVDTHVHVNEPGRTEWEGFETATRAAAAGGVTTIVDMPLNSVPATTTVAALDLKRSVAEGQVFVDVGFWGGAVPDNLADLAPLHAAGVFGFKCFLLDSGVAGVPAPAARGVRRRDGARRPGSAP